jgi:SAM-dependent methyltransferase
MMTFDVNEEDLLPVSKIWEVPGSFEQYVAGRKSPTSLYNAVERPAVYSLLPDVRGKRVLDVGCGVGMTCFDIAEMGAAEVVGLDISSHAIEYARENHAHPRVRFELCSYEDYVPEAPFDLVVSCYTAAVLPDLPGFVRRVFTFLAPGGVLIYSHVHPTHTAPKQQRNEAKYGADESGQRVFLLSSFFDESARPFRIGPNGETLLWVRYHRKASTLINDLIDAGYAIDRVLEPEPTPESMEAGGEALEECLHRPVVMILRASRPSSP